MSFPYLIISMSTKIYLKLYEMDLKLSSKDWIGVFTIMTIDSISPENLLLGLNEFSLNLPKMSWFEKMHRVQVCDVDSACVGSR